MFERFHPRSRCYYFLLPLDANRGFTIERLLFALFLVSPPAKPRRGREPKRTSPEVQMTLSNSFKGATACLWAGAMLAELSCTGVVMSPGRSGTGGDGPPTGTTSPLCQAG